MRILFTVLLFLPLLLTAQTTFTYTAFAPQTGDQYTVSNSNTYCPGSAGANQTWNFAATSTWGTSTYSVVPISSVPAGSQYPNATSAIGTGSYIMLDITASAYLKYGNSITPGMAQWGYSDPEKVFEFPMSYGSTFTDSYQGPDLSSPNYYRIASATVTYEGYGTVITPNGTYTNAICIHRQITESDTMPNGGSLCSGDIYYWFAPGYRYPVVQSWFIGDMNPPCGGLGIGTMFLQSIAIGMEEQLTGNVRLFASPNPVSSELTISTQIDIQNGILVISDLAGRTVKTVSYNGNRMVIDVADLADGIYVARLNDGAGIRVIKN